MITVQKKLVDEKAEGFFIRVKLGDYEVELSGTHGEVMKTLKSLPTLISNVNKAFEVVKPKTVATITVKTAEATSASETSPIQSYPKIASTVKPEEAILKALASEWGKWRPRTMEELNEVMKFNNLKYPGLVLPSILEALVERGLVKRWNTNQGFVYILAEQNNMETNGEGNL